MKGWRSLLPIAISLFIAVLGSYFLYNWIEKQRAPQKVMQVNTEAVPVVVAAGDLSWGAKLKTEMIKTTPYLKESLPVGHFSDIKKLDGRILKSSLKLNEPITENELAPISVETGGVSAVIKPGKRAIAVKGDKVIGISGFINPGNRVDIIVTVLEPGKKEKKTKTILEQIHVLATGTEIQENEKGEPMPVDVYTLEVSPEEAEKLALAASEGRLQLALRSATDANEIYTEGITIPQLLSSYSYTRTEPSKKESQPVVKSSIPKTQIKRKARRRTLTVEIIKGTEISKRNFSL